MGSKECECDEVDTDVAEKGDRRSCGAIVDWNGPTAAVDAVLFPNSVDIGLDPPLETPESDPVPFAAGVASAEGEKPSVLKTGDVAVIVSFAKRGVGALTRKDDTGALEAIVAAIEGRSAAAPPNVGIGEAIE
jgi:hypothetical protein